MIWNKILIGAVLSTNVNGFIVPTQPVGSSFWQSNGATTSGKEEPVSPAHLSSSRRDERTELFVAVDADTFNDESDFVFVDDESSQYTSLQPGSIVTVKAGSPSASRKVWKKRRRSDSPILIPCSVLGMDRTSSIRSNLWYLLQKYGRTLEDKYGGGKGGTNGVAIKVKHAVVRWEREFGGSLMDHASALGYDGIGPLLLSLFESDDSSSISPEELLDHDISILKTSSNLILHAPTLPIRRARSGVSTASLVQMRAESREGLQHTGLVQSVENPDEPPSPLSAALRLSNPNAISRIREGEVVPAYVFQYDPTGDNGQPLLVLSLDPPRVSVRASGSRRVKKLFETQSELRRNKLVNVENKKIEHMFENLKKGHGPFRGKVLNVNARAQAAFVDIGVGRERGKNKGGGVERILGMLRFEDISSESDTTEYDDRDELEETIEDVSDLFEISEDGTEILSVDSTTGARELIGSIEGDEYEEDDEDDNMFAGMSAEERLMAISELLNEDAEPLLVPEKEDKPQVSASEIKVGDDVDVFVLTVSPQSRRFKLSSTRPSASNKYKEVKHKSLVDKRLSKLTAHGSSLASIEELKGTECSGIVKATSKTGNWFYVEPLVNNDQVGSSIPKVGVAHPLDENGLDGTIVHGTRVRVRLEGIDESRGQLSMTLLGKE